MVIGQSASFLPDYSKAKHAAGLVFKALDTVPPIDVYSKRGTFLVCTGNSYIIYYGRGGGGGARFYFPIFRSHGKKKIKA